ncbi:MAG: hypothetical protein ACK5XN_23455, partial [Bacteroidota bacterium]
PLSAATPQAGVSVYTRQDLPCKRRTDLETAAQIVWVEVGLAQRGKLLIGSTYRQHCAGELEWKAISSSITRASRSGLPLLLLGDFNARHPDFGDEVKNEYGDKLADFVSGAQLSVMNALFCPGKPTFPTSRSVLDLAFSNRPAMFIDMQVDDSPLLVSDHFPIVVSLTSARQAPPPATSPRTSWNISGACWEGYQQLLGAALNLTWLPQATSASLLATFAPRSRQTACVNHLWDTLSDHIVSCAELYVGRKRAPGKTKHWWNAAPGVKRCRDAYRRASRRLAKRPADNERKEEYLAAKDAWTKKVRDAKKASWVRLGEKVQDSGSAQLSWPMFSRTVPSNFAPLNSVVNADGDLPDDEQGGLENMDRFLETSSASARQDPAFQDDYQSVVEEVRLLLDDSSPAAATSPLGKPVSMVEVSDAIAGMRRRCAGGPDQIHPLFIILGPEELQRALLLLFNLSWRTGVVPKQW